MTTITATEARRTLFPLIEQVNNDRDPIEITSRRGSAVLVAKEDWDSIVETSYLMRSPANAALLMDAVKRLRTGDYAVHELDRSE